MADRADKDRPNKKDKRRSRFSAAELHAFKSICAYCRRGGFWCRCAQ